MIMWSLVVILVGAQLCLGLPREVPEQQQNQEVDIIKGARVNCKVTATVTYPATPGNDSVPTITCDTKCEFTTLNKDQSYFIGHVYRHFDRLEKEYGLMVEIRYNKGTAKGCNLVPAASNEEVFSAYFDSISPPAPTNVPLKTLATAFSPKTQPSKLPIALDHIQTTLQTTIEPTDEPAKLHIKHSPEPTILTPMAPSTAVPTKLPLKHDTELTTFSQIAREVPENQELGEVDILKGARVNCKVTATVTYPMPTGNDSAPNITCDTKCEFTTNDKDQSYFIGYVYRHFERLEKEYGLMVEIRYNKGTAKGCNLVPAASNEEVISAHIDSNSPPAPTTIPLKTLATAFPPKTQPSKLPIALDPIPTTLQTKIEPTDEPTKLLIKHSPEPTTLSPIAPPAPVPTKLPMKENPKPTTLSPIAPPTPVPTKLPIKENHNPTTLSPIAPPTPVPTNIPIKENPKPKTLSPIAPPTPVPTKLPIKEIPNPTTLSPIAPPTPVPTKLPIKENPNPTTLSPIAPPTPVPTKLPIKENPNPTTLSPIAPPTPVPTKLPIKENPNPTTLSPIAPPTPVPTKLPIKENPNPTTLSPIAPPTPVPTKLPIKENPNPTTLSPIAPPTPVPTKLPIKDNPNPTTLSPIAPPTPIPTKLPIKDNPKPTTLSPIAPPTPVPTKLSIKENPIPTTMSPIAPRTPAPTKQPIKENPEPSTMSPIASPTPVPTKLPIKENTKPTPPSSISPPTPEPTKIHIKYDPEPTTLSPRVKPTKVPATKNKMNNPTSMKSPTKMTQDDSITSFNTEPTPTEFDEFESTTDASTTFLDNYETDWVLIGKSYFHISKVRGDWSKGQDYCADIGATLASVRSQEEQDGLANLVGANAWIGLHDMQTEGDHQWEDQTNLTYSNWEPGQPDDDYLWWLIWWDKEDCVEMTMMYNLHWNDEDCGHHNIFICRRDDELLE